MHFLKDTHQQRQEVDAFRYQTHFRPNGFPDSVFFQRNESQHCSSIAGKACKHQRRCSAKLTAKPSKWKKQTKEGCHEMRLTPACTMTLLTPFIMVANKFIEHIYTIEANCKDACSKVSAAAAGPSGVRNSQSQQQVARGHQHPSFFAQ